MSQPLLDVPAFSYVDSAASPIMAVVDTYYVVDTAKGPVSITLPAGVTVGHWIIVQNAPAGGRQLGGDAGSDVTVYASNGESFENATSVVIKPPSSPVTAACNQFFPTGSGDQSGFGQGWAHV